jgi:cytochrome c-type biogenesis protein CcmH/NrfG
LARHTRHQTIQHALTAAVAAASVAIALADGGYYQSGFAISSLVCWAIVLAGLAAGFLPRAEPPRPALVAGLALAGLAGLTALSMAWAADQGAAFDDAIRVLAYLGLFAVVVLATRSGESGIWLRGLAIGTTVVAALALLARLEPSLLGHPERELAAEVPAVADRLSWPIGYWNGLAALLAVSVGLLVWLGASAVTRAGRAVAIGALPLPVLGLYATTSRGGMIAAGVAVAVLVIAGPRRLRLSLSGVIGLGVGGALVAVASGRDALFDQPGTDLAASQGDEVLAMLIGALLIAAALRYWLDPRLERARGPALGRRAWMWIGIGAAVVAIAAIVVWDPGERWEEFKRPPTLADTANERDVLSRGGSSGRWQFWSAAYDAFETEPLRGIGAGGYPDWWNQHGSLGVDTGNAHSLAMDTIAELGLVGIAAVLAFFAVIAVIGVGRVRADRRADGAAAAALALFAAALVGVAADWTWDLPAVFAPAVVAAGLLTGPGTLPAEIERTPIRGEARSRRRFAAGVAVLAFAWIALCASGVLVAARYELTASENALEEGDFTTAAEQANNAADLEPWAAEPRRQLAQVMLAAGNYPEAEKAIDEAIDRAEDDPELWLIAAQIQLAAGDRPAAAVGVAVAKELAPRAPELQPDIDELLAQIGS